MRYSPEAGYNFEEAHHTSGKPMYLLEHVACRDRVPQWSLRGKEYRNVACRGWIPQFGLRRKEYRNQIQRRHRLFRTTLHCDYENPPFYLKAMIEQARERQGIQSKDIVFNRDLTARPDATKTIKTTSDKTTASARQQEKTARDD